MSTVLQRDFAPSCQDFLPLHGADYLEFYVGNAQQAAYYYRMAMGMRLVGYAGPETGRSDCTSFVLQQGGVRLVLTSSLRPGTEMAEHVHRHGDGIRDVALAVSDARQAWREATGRGARSVREPFDLSDENGTVRMASIAACGETVHTLVERRKYRGCFLPGYAAVAHDPLARSTGIEQVDHIGAIVGWREMSRWAGFYSQAMGFSPGSGMEKPPDGVCSTAMTKPLTNGSGRLRFILEGSAEAAACGLPCGGGKSPVAEYLEFNHGPGIEHIGLSTSDILYTVSRMREQGIDFAPVEPSYYSSLGRPPVWLREPLSDLERLGIRIGGDEEGPMLEAATRPVEDRPTLYFKIVQRKGRC